MNLHPGVINALYGEGSSDLSCPNCGCTHIVEGSVHEEEHDAVVKFAWECGYGYTEGYRRKHSEAPLTLSSRKQEDCEDPALTACTSLVDTLQDYLRDVDATMSPAAPALCEALINRAMAHLFPAGSAELVVKEPVD